MLPSPMMWSSMHILVLVFCLSTFNYHWIFHNNFHNSPIIIHPFLNFLLPTYSTPKVLTFLNPRVYYPLLLSSTFFNVAIIDQPTSPPGIMDVNIPANQRWPAQSSIRERRGCACSFFPHTRTRRRPLLGTALEGWILMTFIRSLRDCLLGSLPWIRIRPSPLWREREREEEGAG